MATSGREAVAGRRIIGWKQTESSSSRAEDQEIRLLLDNGVQLVFSLEHDTHWEHVGLVWGLDLPPEQDPDWTIFDLDNEKEGTDGS